MHHPVILNNLSSQPPAVKTDPSYKHINLTVESINRLCQIVNEENAHLQMSVNMTGFDQNAYVANQMQGDHSVLLKSPPGPSQRCILDVS